MSSPTITAPAMARGAARLEQELRKIIRGRDDVIRMALVAIFARGHLLIEGVPGVGKTTLAHALARSLDCSFQRVQFTSDLLPSDVLGISIYSPIEQKFEFKPGPVFANVLLADEINRTTPKTQSALLEAMNERQVTVDRGSYPLPEPFLVIATQNPVEHHGTYPLPESQMDRFLLRVAMTYPEAGSEREILRSEVGAAKLDELRPVLTAAEVSAMQGQVTRVRVDDSLADYALAIVNKTRESELLALAIWLGGILFFSAGAAPAVLHSVSDRALGGAIISEALTRLHWMGVVCGAIFLAASLAYSKIARGCFQVFSASKLLVALMIGLTLISQLVIMPRMAALRTAASAASYTDFARLHQWSVSLEGGTLFLGLIVLYLEARR